VGFKLACYFRKRYLRKGLCRFPCLLVPIVISAGFFFWKQRVRRARFKQAFYELGMN